MKTLTWWDVHTDKVAHRSGRWASSDRGWLFRDGAGAALGHYLDYAGCSGYDNPDKYPDGTVHAVVCGDRGGPCRVSRMCRDVAAAQRWIEEQLGLGACVVNPRSRIYRKRAA